MKISNGSLAIEDLAIITQEEVSNRSKQSSSGLIPQVEGREGGIDFKAENMDVTIKGDEIDFAMPANMNIESLMNAEGLVPIIINIVPVTNFYKLLGLDEGEDEGSPAPLAIRAEASRAIARQSRFFALRKTGSIRICNL